MCPTGAGAGAASAVVVAVFLPLPRRLLLLTIFVETERHGYTRPRSIYLVDVFVHVGPAQQSVFAQY